MINKDFENSTRQSALEIISSIAESMPNMLRKQTNELKEHFFPALFKMMLEV